MGKTYHYDPSDDGLTKVERKALNQRRQARIVARMNEMLAEAEKHNG